MTFSVWNGYKLGPPVTGKSKQRLIQFNLNWMANCRRWSSRRTNITAQNLPFPSSVFLGFRLTASACWLHSKHYRARKWARSATRFRPAPEWLVGRCLPPWSKSKCYLEKSQTGWRCLHCTLQTVLSLLSGRYVLSICEYLENIYCGTFTLQHSHNP